MNESNKLYLSSTNKWIFGVCGGIAEYFRIDPIIVRLAFMLWFFIFGTGIIIYLLAALIIPKPLLTTDDNIPAKPNKISSIVPASLIIIGIYLLLQKMDYFELIKFKNSQIKFVLPVVLIATGMFLLLNYNKQKSTESSMINKLTKSNKDRVYLGVCGGISEYLNINSLAFRIFWVLFTIISLGLGILVYFVAASYLKYYEEK